MRVRVALDVPKLLVVRKGTAVGLLVGRHDVDAALKPILVVKRDILRRGAVDDDRVGRAAVGDGVDEPLHVHLITVRVVVLPRAEVQRDGVVVDREHLGLPGDGDDSQVDVVGSLELGELLLHLPEQCFAHEPGADDADGHDRLGEVEPAVDRAQRLGDVLLGDDAGDVVLGSALRDCHDVDGGVGEGFEEHG